MSTKEEIRTLFLELSRLALDLNHPDDFQVNLEINGNILCSELKPTFTLYVTKDSNFASCYRFTTIISNGLEKSFCHDMTRANIGTAKKWLLELHEQLAKTPLVA